MIYNNWLIIQFRQQMKQNILRKFFENYSIQESIDPNNQIILKDKINQQLILLKRVTITQQCLYQDTIEALQQQKDLKNQHLLGLLDYISQQNYHTHGSITLQIFYQQCKMTLSSQAFLRRSQGNCFSEDQLWNIMLSVVEAAAYLQLNGIGHGSISPEDIYISNTGTVKLGDPTLASSNPFTFNQGSYYSIQLLNYFQQGSISSLFNIYKSDVFSLGMTMLQAALLQPCIDCYNYHQLSININKLNNRLRILGNCYSQQFLNILLKCLELNEEERPDFIFLKQQIMKIHQYEQQIQRQVEEGDGQLSYNIHPGYSDALKFSEGSSGNDIGNSNTNSIKQQDNRTMKYTSRTKSNNLSNQSRKLLNFMHQTKLQSVRPTLQTEDYFTHLLDQIKNQYFQAKEDKQNHNNNYTDPSFLSLMQKDTLQIIKRRITSKNS